MLKPVDWKATKLFVEYGPGVGTFTRPILEKMGKGAKLIAIDTNAEFIRYLSESIPDERLVAVTGSAADVEKIIRDHGFDHADYVLSGLPFSTLPPGVGDAISKATAKVIRPGGAFLVYQFSAKVFDFIEPWFDRIDRGFEWINVPPAKLFWAWKADAKPARRGRRQGPGPEKALLVAPEVEAAGDGVVHRRHQPVRQCPFEPPPQGRPAAVLGRGDLVAQGQLALEIATYRIGERLVLDPQHDLEVDVDAAQVEIGRADVDDVVDNHQLGVQPAVLILEHPHPVAQHARIIVPGGGDGRIIV